VSRRAARFGGVVTIVLLLLMTLGNQLGQIQNIFLIGTAGLIAGIMVIDWVLRRNGLRS
jgi:hypothetical protein